MGEPSSHMVPQARDAQKRIFSFGCSPSPPLPARLGSRPPFPIACCVGAGAGRPRCLACSARVRFDVPPPPPSLLGCLQPKKASSSQCSVLTFLPAPAKPSGPGALALKLTPTPSFSLSLSSAPGQGLQLCFSLSVSGWLLANFNKGAMLTDLEVALISASTACFHLPVLHLFLTLIIACYLAACQFSQA